MGEMLDLFLQMEEMNDCEFYNPRPYGEGPCPECGSETVLREGKYGKFYGCIDFPKCRGTRDFSS